MTRGEVELQSIASMVLNEVDKRLRQKRFITVSTKNGPLHISLDCIDCFQWAEDDNQLEIGVNWAESALAVKGDEGRALYEQLLQSTR